MNPRRSDSSRAAKMSWPGLIGMSVLWVLLLGVSLWAFGALAYDFPIQDFRFRAAFIYAVGLVLVLCFVRPWKLGLGIAFGLFGIVLLWWFSLRPSNDRQWQADVAQTGWAEVNGDEVTLHNVRNCDYRTETDYTVHWETRTVNLAKLRGVDIAIDYWGSPWIAHPIVSFQFDGALPVCFSIETRREVGESYSAIGGLYRQYELIYICSDERDVFRVRTNYRKGEDLYLYRTRMSPEKVRERFMEYIAALNALHAKPRWYNAATTNCTTSIRTQHSSAERKPWDWRILLNGFMDKMLFEQGAFAGDLPFEQLKKRARINDAARAADQSPDFSERIRASRPGFGDFSRTTPPPQ